ncbi:MogA/MoaB family molybdenum cofactor biosynthesis protein [bacterium]|nr:MogA/MoaB family molybdenum cofactor biosynthesis protein [bacterium]
MKVLVITLSDRASAGIYEDRSGPEIEKVFHENIENLDIKRVIIPDEKEDLLKALKDGLWADFIITTGGTGISPRDITPEVCRDFCEKELPGIAEILRLESYKETPMAMLSRAYSGMKDRSIVVNFPGSVKGARCCANVMITIMDHALKMRDGKGH